MTPTINRKGVELLTQYDPEKSYKLLNNHALVIQLLQVRLQTSAGLLALLFSTVIQTSNCNTTDKGSNKNNGGTYSVMCWCGRDKSNSNQSSEKPYFSTNHYKIPYKHDQYNQYNTMLGKGLHLIVLPTYFGLPTM